MSFSEPDAGAVVAASPGWDAYQLWRFSAKRGEKWECECATWRTLGRTCKHMDLAKKAVTGAKVPGVISSWCNPARRLV